ncbi:MAG: M48 family metalloprotease, partial [Phycisphaerales bacterium]
MTFVDYIDSMPLVQSLGWMLLHFIWQGAVVAAALAIVLSLMRHLSASARYVTCCVGMVVMLIAPMVTLAIILCTPAKPIGALAAGLPMVDLDSIPLWHRLTTYLPALTLFWLTGVCIFQARLIMNWLGARHLRRAGTSPAALAWRRSVDELCIQLGIRRRVEILESTLATVPMVLGWLNPVILVPVSALTGLTTRQLRTVIAHELAHVRRHDYIINLVQAVFESLLFYHPAVWWLSNRLRVEREYCCDDVAVRVCGDALCYARALSSLEALRTDRRQPALASTGGSLMHRIFRVVGIGSKPCRRVGGWLAPILIAVSLTAAASAMIITSATEGDGTPKKKVVKVKAIDQVDIVALAKKLGSKRAKLLYDLREAGLDNEALLVVLGELEPDKELVKAVTVAAKEKMGEHAQQVKMSEYEAQLIKKMKAEGASKKEITKALEQFRKEVKAKLASNPGPDELTAKEQHLIQEMKEAGASKEEITKALEQFRKEVKAKLA